MGASQLHWSIVFDFGGVLMDWSPYYLYRKLMKDDREIEAFLNEIGFNSWNVEFDKGYPFARGVEEHCQKYPQYCELIRAFDARWLETDGGPIQATVEVAGKLKAQGYPLFALSNWSTEKFKLVKGKYKFFNWFDSIVLSGEEKLGKPDAAIFHRLLQRIDREAGECIFIDDSPLNIATAGELGFHCIHYRSTGQLIEELEKFGISF